MKKLFLKHSRFCLNKNREFGFTLAEFFIAITIFSFIALTLIYSLNIALTVYKREQSFDDPEGLANLVSNILEKEINRSVVVGNLRLIGTAESLYFCAPYAITNDHYLNKITYTISASESGEITINKKTENPFPLNEGEDIETYGSLYSYSLSNRIKGLKFSYLLFNNTEEEEEEQTFVWQDNWSEEAYPDAIKLHYSLQKNKIETQHDTIIMLSKIWNSIPIKEEEKSE